jgi:hypothetical protein
MEDKICHYSALNPDLTVASSLANIGKHLPAIDSTLEVSCGAEKTAKLSEFLFACSQH